MRLFAGIWPFMFFIADKIWFRVSIGCYMSVILFGIVYYFVGYELGRKS